MENSNEELYVNPVNTNEIIEKLKNTETHDEIVNIINETFPTWILGWLKAYSSDYPHFQKNWENVCTSTKTKPLRVVIVNKIVFNDENYSLLRMFCELLTLFGHSVRRKEEFVECKLCGDALPTPYIYNALKEKGTGIKIPLFWSPKCSTC
jgi:hypothetical protein